MLRQVWHARAEGNAEAVAAQGVQRVFGDGVDGRLMQLESRLWVYALMRRPAAAPFAGEQQFSAHRQNGNASPGLANATGNFTKIVQRVPVRVSFPDAVPAPELLRPGLSVVVRIDTRDPGSGIGAAARPRR